MQMSAGAHNGQRHQSSPGAGVTGVCELPSVGVGDQTWIPQSTFLTAEPSLLSQQSVSVLNVMCI